MNRGHFSWFELIDVVHAHHGVLVPFLHAMLSVAVLLVLALIARRAITSRPSGPEGLVPDRTLTARNVFEIFTEGLLGLIRPVLGKDTERFFPLIAGTFVYIFVTNLQGVLPGFQPATATLSSNVGMAVVIFLVYNIAGIARQGIVPYLKHMAGPVLAIAPLLFVIEIISHLSRPLSLSVRLFGNMFGDHTVLGVFLYIIPDAMQSLVGPFAKVLAFGIPVIFIALGVFVSFIQALVFSFLSTIYLGLALDDHH